MAEELIKNLIRDKVTELGYESVTARLTLVKDENWKVFISKFIFDLKKPTSPKTLIKKNNFALEDFSLSIEEFYQFLNYLDKVYVGNVKILNNKIELTDDLLFKFGNYKLCFAGNFPSRELYFFGRQVAEEHHGVSRPTFFVDYAIHQAAAGVMKKEIEFLDYKVPLRDGVETINYFWKTNYEHHSMTSNRCNLYLPLFDANIKNCVLDSTQFQINLDVDQTQTELNELSLAIIANNKGHEHRKKHPVNNKEMLIDVGFVPNYASIYLNRGDMKIDEFNYYTPSPGIYVSEVAATDSDYVETTELEQKDMLFDLGLIAQQPKHLQQLLHESQKAFKARLYRSTTIVLRCVLEEGLTIMLEKIGKGDELYLDNFEIGLQRKLRLALDGVPAIRPIKTDLETIKWFGDKASHESSLTITKGDIKDNLAPKIRLFLGKIDEAK